MSKRRNTIVEVITGLSFVGLSIGIWIIADGFYAPVVADPLGPAFWPKFIVAWIALLSVFLVVHALLRRSPKKEAEDILLTEDTVVEEATFSAWRFGGILALIVMYAEMLEVLGYILATPLFIISVLLLLGIRSWKSLLVTAIGIPLLWSVLFQVLLNVPLPEGLFSIWHK